MLISRLSGPIPYLIWATFWGQPDHWGKIQLFIETLGLHSIFLMELCCKLQSTFNLSFYLPLLSNFPFGLCLSWASTSRDLYEIIDWRKEWSFSQARYLVVCLSCRNLEKKLTFGWLLALEFKKYKVGFKCLQLTFT